MFYWRNKDYKIPEILLINGKKIELEIRGMNIHEFTEICINDCYHLRYLKKKLRRVKSIVDIGANHGMCVIAARQIFPSAKIDCYEPNPQLADTLGFNAMQLNATPYFEAVMKKDCKVNLNFAESDLATSACESKTGKVTGSSLRTVIKRSGVIDILKLDCEGAEWELLKDTQSWEKIKSLSMEYHLWAKASANVENLYQLLNSINFKIVHHTNCNSGQGFVLAINRNYFEDD